MAPPTEERPPHLDAHHYLHEPSASGACDVASDAVRVVLAEDNVLLREGLARLLEGAADLELVGTYGDYDALLAGVAEVGPDVVVTDIRMPPGHDDEGIRAAAALRVSP